MTDNERALLNRTKRQYIEEQVLLAVLKSKLSGVLEGSLGSARAERLYKSSKKEGHQNTKKTSRFLKHAAARKAKGEFKRDEKEVKYKEGRKERLAAAVKKHGTRKSKKHPVLKRMGESFAPLNRLRRGR